jgi:glycosyltransferase 2 family protein
MTTSEIVPIRARSRLRAALGPAARGGRRLHCLHRLLPAVLGLVGIGALLLAVGPAQLWAALARFPLAAGPAVVLLLAGTYAAQGWRWHYLLRDAGVRLSLRDSELLNVAGQVVTAVIPIGDLTRAAFASQAARADFGEAAATVTVQELSYTVLLVLVATPGIVALGAGPLPAIVVLAGVAAVVALLVVQPIFDAADALVGRLPLLRRVQPQVEELQRSTAALLRRPRTLAGASVDLARALAAVTAFWLIADQLEPGRLSWTAAAFVLTFSYVGGAVSMVPGGVGANEASMVGLLAWSGMSPGPAAAAAILQRAFVTGLAVVLGMVAYSVARDRLGLGSLAGLPRALERGRPTADRERCPAAA